MAPALPWLDYVRTAHTTPAYGMHHVQNAPWKWKLPK